MKLRNNNQIPTYVKREIRARERELAIAMQATLDPDSLPEFPFDPYVPKGSLYPATLARNKMSFYEFNKANGILTPFSKYYSSKHTNTNSKNPLGRTMPAELNYDRSQTYINSVTAQFAEPDFDKFATVQPKETKPAETDSAKVLTYGTNPTEVLTCETDFDKTSSAKESSAETQPAKFVKINSKNLHSGHRERLKQQYLNNGISAMTDIQQLELLLFYAIPQKDTNPIAHKLLERFGTIKNVLNASVYDLCTIDGIKESSATFLKLISNMANVCSKPQERELINSTRLAREYCQKFYVGVPLEQFHVVCLSKDSKVIGSKMIKAGTVDEIKVGIRDITEFAISINCTRILVSHNHPEGKGEMSDEDLKFTYSLVCSCLLNNIDIIDHIIVGQDANYSLSEHGIMGYLKQRAFQKVLVPKDTQIVVSSNSDKYVVSESYPTTIKDVKL